MRSKNVTWLLALFFGSSGAQRFYIGQNKKGLTYLTIFWILLPVSVWALKHFFIQEYWRGLYWLWLLSIIIFQIVECIRFASIKKEKFELLTKSGGSAFTLPFFAIIVASLLGYSTTQVLKEKKIDIKKAIPDFQMTSAEFDGAFRTSQKNDGENSFNAMYLHKVIQLEGEVANTGNDLEEGNFLELQGAADDAFDVRCTFNPENAGKVDQVVKGMMVSLKGQCDGNKLYNCFIIEIKETIKNAAVDSMQNKTDSSIVK